MSQYVTADRLAMVCQEWRRDILFIDERLAKVENVAKIGGLEREYEVSFRAELRKLEEMFETFVTMCNGRMRGLELALELERVNRERNFAALSEAFIELEDDKVSNLQKQVSDLKEVVAILQNVVTMEKGDAPTTEGTRQLNKSAMVVEKWSEVNAATEG